MKTLISLLLICVFSVPIAYAQDPPRNPQPNTAFQVTAIESDYPVATGGLNGTIHTGQAADMMLSGFGFNQSGGGLQFNHPRSLATDGQRLLVSDGNNNRVLIWHTPPTANTPPDLVLGQPDFDSNAAGNGLHQLNWPGQVSVTPDGKVLVADTYNNRLLLWNTFPTSNAQPADMSIETASLHWPWGVWSDGTRLVATSTGGRAILVWNNIPTQPDSTPDLVLQSPDIGTPRTITSNGTTLIVGDHNAFGDQHGNFVWTTFPTTNNQPYDFFIDDPGDARMTWLQGTFTPEGGLLMLGRNLYLWNSPPTTSDSQPDLMLDGYRFVGGDGGGVAIAEGRVYIIMYNSNKVVVYNSLPTSADQLPDFALGSPSIDINTLDTAFIMTNPAPVTDGQSLWVSSDYDRKLYVWEQIPDSSGAAPDWVYSLPFPPWDNALFNNTLIVVGSKQVAFWTSAPRAGELPDVQWVDSFGGVTFEDLRGVALDAQYLYLADDRAGKIYVWPHDAWQQDTPAAPLFTLDLEHPSRLSSDGTYLVVTAIEQHAALVYRLDELGTNTPPQAVGGMGQFNRPWGVLFEQGWLWIADTNNALVHGWSSIEAALAGEAPTVLLGQRGQNQIGEATLFWPGALAFDGSYLWLGETKFSQRLLRFSVAD